MASRRARSSAALLCLLLAYGSRVAASILAATPVHELVPGMNPTVQIPEITAMPAFHGNDDLRKRDFWYECGFCCGDLTLSCGNGAYCKVTETFGNAFGYCSTIDADYFYLFTAAQDYKSGLTTCGAGTVCCDSTQPFALKWVFEPTSGNDLTTTMYGCATAAQTVIGTAAADFVTDASVPLESGSGATYSLPTLPSQSSGKSATPAFATSITDQASATNAEGTSSSTPTGSNTSSNTSSSHSDTSGIVGGVVGGVAFLALCAGLGFWFYRRHKRNQSPSHIENMSAEAKARTNLLGNVGPNNMNNQQTQYQPQGPYQQGPYQQYQQGQWQPAAYEMNAQPNVYEMNGQQPMHEMSSNRPLQELDSNDRRNMR